MEGTKKLRWYRRKKGRKNRKKKMGYNGRKEQGREEFTLVVSVCASFSWSLNLDSSEYSLK